MATYRISELAKLVGLPPSTLRFYEQIGLVPARRSESGYRLFDGRAVERVQVIAAGKGLGLRLEEIRDLLRVWEDGLCADVREQLRPMVVDRLADAERRAAEIGAFIARLQQASSVIDGPVPPGRCGPGCGIMPHPDSAGAAPARGELTDRRPSGEPEAPIACTLTGADQAGRIEEWRRLLDQAEGPAPVDRGLVFRFPAELAGQVGELAAAEQRCCPFFEFALHLAAGEVRFEVRVPENATALLADVFGTERTDCGCLPEMPGF